MAKEYGRRQRVNQLLKEEIAKLLLREVKDARIGAVTVSAVEASPDLMQANVYVQVPGDDARKAEALEGLASAAGFIRSRLGRDLRIRRSPELRFIIDRTQEHAARIHELLAEVERENETDSSQTDASQEEPEP